MESKKLSFKIYFNEPERSRNVSGINTGPLVQELLEEPLFLGGVHENGEIKVILERTHEWEIALELLINGSGEFVAGVTGGLGGIFAQWLVNKASNDTLQKSSEITADQGVLKVIVTPENLKQAAKDTSKLIDKALKSGGEVQIIVDPKRRDLK